MPELSVRLCSSNLYCEKRVSITAWLRATKENTLLRYLRELLDLSKLFLARFRQQKLVLALEEVPVRIETRTRWNDTIVVLDASSIDGTSGVTNEKHNTFPVRMPLARAENTVVPIPYFLYKGLKNLLVSTSTQNCRLHDLLVFAFRTFATQQATE